MHQSLFSRRLKEWKKVELAAAAAAALVSLPCTRHAIVAAAAVLYRR